MTAQKKADKIHEFLTKIKEVSGSEHVSLMIHGFDYTHDLDSTWEKRSLFVESNNDVVLTAEKDGITLFGQKFKVKHEELEAA